MVEYPQFLFNNPGNEEEFEFIPDEYSVPLQLAYNLLVRNAEIVDADMRFYLLDSVRLLALQCDVLSGAQKKHKKFIKWCQEHLLTGIMWKLLESAHSQVYHYTFLLLYSTIATVDNSINNHHRLSIFLQVAQVAVPLMLHSVTLPGGSDVLWTILDEDFHRYT